MKNRSFASRRWLIWPLSLAAVAALTGCVGYLHDPKAASLKPASAGLADFAGTYKDRAIYETPPGFTGMCAAGTLGNAIWNRDFGSDVALTVTNGMVELRPVDDAVRTNKPVVYSEGKDFDFRDHRMVFRHHWQMFNADAVAVGLFHDASEWSLDESGNLVMVNSGSGAGTFMVAVPVLAASQTVCVFARVKPELERPPANASEKAPPPVPKE